MWRGKREQRPIMDRFSDFKFEEKIYLVKDFMRNLMFPGFFPQRKNPEKESV